MHATPGVFIPSSITGNYVAENGRDGWASSDNVAAFGDNVTVLTKVQGIAGSPHLVCL